SIKTCKKFQNKSLAQHCWEFPPYSVKIGCVNVYKWKGERLTSDQIAAAEAQKKEAKEKPKAFKLLLFSVAAMCIADSGAIISCEEIKVEWGKGLAQKREAEERQQELELEKAKPFARTRDDPDLDKMLKERVRWGDPMAHLVKVRRHLEMDLPDLGDDEKMKESGFIIPQGIPNHSWLKRGLEAAPNRYNIKPGRHWDGVDRSTDLKAAGLMQCMISILLLGGIFTAASSENDNIFLLIILIVPLLLL
ncbi:hypothetical protein RJ639_025698, partial [Escallonia herrerae]